MDVFTKIDKVDEENIHPKFKLLRDEPYYRGAKKIIENWTEDFHDRDNKILIEFQKTFHSSFWEFYLHAVFSEMKLPLNTKHNRPDFIIEGDRGFYVEAVVSEIKDGGTAESERTLEDQLSMLSPIKTDEEFSDLIDEAIVRHSNSINSKLNKYTGYINKKGKWKEGYKDCEWICSDKPYVVALASYDQVNYGKEYIYSMMALLYGLYYSPEKKAYIKRDEIVKPGTESKVKLGIFDSEEMKDVSAVFFTNTLTLGKLSSLSKSTQADMAHVINIRYDFEPPHYKIHEVEIEHPEYLLDGLYVFINPNAKVNLDCKDLLENHLLHITVDEIGTGMEGARRPIVARYCSPFGHQYRELIKSTAASNYNETIAYDILPE